MQPLEFRHFSKRTAVTNEVVQRAMAKNRDSKNVHHIVSRISYELDESRKMKISYESEHSPKLNFNH